MFPLQVETMYITAAEDNTRNLMHIIRQFSSIEEFLSDDNIHLSVNSTTVTNLEQSSYLDYAFDIDGVVVELEGLSALKLLVPYFNFPKPSKATLQPGFHLLKKHIKSNHYSRKGFKCFQMSKGLTLAQSQVHLSEVLITMLLLLCS